MCMYRCPFITTYLEEIANLTSKVLYYRTLSQQLCRLHTPGVKYWVSGLSSGNAEHTAEYSTKAVGILAKSGICQ